MSSKTTANVENISFIIIKSIVQIFLTHYYNHWKMAQKTLTNTQRVFQIEATWKRSFSLRFNVKYTWYVGREAYNTPEL